MQKRLNLSSVFVSACLWILCLVIRQMHYSNVIPYEMESRSIKLPLVKCMYKV